MTPADALTAAERRGLIQDATDRDGLAQRMQAPLTAYAGFDPTAGSLHVGHLVPIMLLRLLARHGHTAIAVIGGVTAQIGDPSGRQQARQLLETDTVAGNVARLRGQLTGLLGDTATILDNADWLAPQSLPAFLRDIGPHFQVSRMLAADAVARRLDAGTGLSALEFFYPLLQAADFLTLFRTHGCRLQIGGSDQWSNICAGIDLIRRVEGDRTFGLTQPLVTAANGAKMGKTAQGAVWLDPELTDDQSFFQFWRNTDDRDVARFLRLFTELDEAAIQDLTAEGGAALNAAKARLAREVTALVHGPEVAERQARAAQAVFAGDGRTAELPEIAIATDQLAQGLSLAALLHEQGLAPSRSAARRLLAQGGVRLNGTRQGPDDTLAPDDLAGGHARLSVGRKRHFSLIPQGSGGAG